MTNQNIEKDIEFATQRIEIRQIEIESELAELASKISSFTKWAWIFVWLGGAISLVSILYYVNQNDGDGFGLNLLGDFMAGSVASIWSLAGLFFIYVAFLGQKQQLLNQQLEIMYSQIEVKYTRLELSGQKVEMKEQNDTLRQQKFENTFFQLLSLFTSIVNSLDLRQSISKGEVFSTGRDCFEHFYKQLTSFLHHSINNQSSLNIQSSRIEQALDAYDILYDSNKSDMSHYFRTLYHIIKFVDKSNVENKKQYTSIVRAQLSSYEQVILFYNCLHNNGRDKFKPLIETYAIFKNLDVSLIYNKDHLKEYEQGAYK